MNEKNQKRRNKEIKKQGNGKNGRNMCVYICVNGNREPELYEFKVRGVIIPCKCK